MDIWVAGATGVLGRETVPRLLAAGHAVTGLARSTSKWPDAPAEMRFVPCDVTSPGAVLQAFSGHKPDAILHLATAIPPGRPTAEEWAANDAVRRAGTSNLIEAAVLSESYYVQQSVHYVAAPNGDNWIDESAPVAHASRIDSAIEAEALTRKAISEGLHACIIRPATFYSKDSPQTTALLNALKSHVPILIGNGQNYWSFIHPSDVATALVNILERKPAGETYFLADDEPARMADCLHWLADHMGAPPPKNIAPFLAKLAVGGDTVDLLTGSRRICNTRAKNELGWTPAYPTYREGFTKVIADLGL